MKKYFFVLTVLALLASCSAGPKKKFIVTFEQAVIDCPVKVDLTAMFEEIPENLKLVEKTEEGTVEVTYQHDESEGNPAIWFIASGVTKSGEKRQYTLSGTSKIQAQSSKIEIEQNTDQLIISESEKERVVYSITEVPAPEGKDKLYERSAHIHPLYSPGGHLLTNIQPIDHIHHYGIWNPWTKTHIRGKEIDFWNLARGMGTVSTRDILQKTTGALFADFTALQEHIAFDFFGEDSLTVIDEFWDVRYWKEYDDRYMLDLTTTLRNVLQDTVFLDRYRYGGGLGYRATDSWNHLNSKVLTSEGNTREDADGTRARWCIIEGTSEGEKGKSGILFLSHPTNREHPEPLRVWPPNMHRGELFFEFCPIRLKGWEILPGADNILKYRMVVYDGEMTAEEAEMHWNAFVGHGMVAIN